MADIFTQRPRRASAKYAEECTAPKPRARRAPSLPATRRSTRITNSSSTISASSASSRTAGSISASTSRASSISSTSSSASSSSTSSTHVDPKMRNGQLDFKTRKGQPPLKKQRAIVHACDEKPKRIRRRGVLERVNELPLDIVFEIFCQLDPLALLYLSWTSKDLRAFLMNPRHNLVWVAARGNVDGLPPTPSIRNLCVGEIRSATTTTGAASNQDSSSVSGPSTSNIPDTLLSEPAYAQMMFDTTCSECGSRNGKHVEWVTKLKMCRSCLMMGTTFVCADEAGQMMRGVLELPLFENIVPSYTCEAVPTYYYVRSEVEALKARLLACRSDNYAGNTFYFRHHPVLREERRRAAERQEAAQPFKDFQARRDVARKLAAKQRKTQRPFELAERLVKMGWGGELGLKLREEGRGAGASGEWVAPVQVDKDAKGTAFAALQKHKLAKRAKALGDDEWTKIEGTLVELMQEEKIKREEYERRMSVHSNVASDV